MYAEITIIHKIHIKTFIAWQAIEFWYIFPSGHHMKIQHGFHIKTQPSVKQYANIMSMGKHY